MSYQAKTQNPSIKQDFDQAMTFYDLNFGEELKKYPKTFPCKYPETGDFLVQFQELDQIERLLWCDHHLKESFIQHKKKDGQTFARKNILWTLMLCKQFKMKLSRQYNLMKMIKFLWIYDLQARPETKEKLAQIFAVLGIEYNDKRPTKFRNTSKSWQHSSSDAKRTQKCGCMGNICIIC